MHKYCAYYRVSTAKQGRSGLGLSAQRETVSNYLQSVQGTLCGSFVEVESGKIAERPELAKALAQCRLQNAVLVIAKLDRLSRNVAFIATLMDSGAEFVACDMPAAGRFTLHIMASVAEHEARMISERTRLALAAAKRKGTVLGGNRGKQTRSQLLAANKASAKVRNTAALQRAKDLAPVIAELRRAGVVSLVQIAANLNSRGIATARGSTWSSAQVYRVMQAVAG